MERRMRRGTRGAVVAVGLLSFAGLVGAETIDGRGFRLRVPDGWVIATEENLAAARHELGKQFADIDLDRVEALLYYPAADVELFANVNVVSAPGRVDIDDEPKARRSIQQQFRALGVRISDFDLRVEEIAGRDAFSAEWNARFPDQDPIRQRTCLVPSAKRTIVITFTTSVDDFEARRPDFAAILASLEVDPDRGAWWRNMPRFLRWALIGGALGLLYAAGAALSKKRSARTADRA